MDDLAPQSAQLVSSGHLAYGSLASASSLRTITFALSA